MASAWASRTARRRRRALVVAATSVATAALSSCSSSSCGGPSSAPLAEGGGGRDTSAIDVTSVLDGGSGDSAAPFEASACGPDGSVAGLSDWPGWVRLLGATPACRFDGPTNLANAIPPWSWIPCTNGAAGCLEFQAGWPLPQGAPFRFQKFAVSHDPLGNAKWLRIERLIDGAATFEDDLYDVASGAPLGAWRRDDLGGDCAIVAFAGATSVSLFGFVKACGLYGANGAPAALLSSPAFQQLAGTPLPGVSGAFASDTTVAFGVSLLGVVGRWPVGSLSYATTPADAASLSLQLEMLEGNDTYAESEHGTSGWQQVYRIDVDGSVVLFLSAPNAHIAAPRTDGTTLFWLQIYGTTDVTMPQQRVEAWAAPYSSDPTQVAATARKIALLPETAVLGDAVAFQGLYAVNGAQGVSAYVVRLADGATARVAPGSTRAFFRLGLVSPTELWSVMADVNGLNGSELQRTSLGSW